MASELLEEFIYDSREHLNHAGNQLLRLEKTPSSLDDLNDLAGTIHTIKGNCGFLNLTHLYELLHGAESILQTIRGQTPLFSPPEALNLMFQVMDTVEAILFRLEKNLDDQVDWLPALNQRVKELEADLENQARPLEAPGRPDPAEKPENQARLSPEPTSGAPQSTQFILNLPGLENHDPDQIKPELTKLLAQSDKPVVIGLALINNLSRAGLNYLVELRSLAPGRITFAVAKEQLNNYQRLWRLMGLDEAREIIAAD